MVSDAMIDDFGVDDQVSLWVVDQVEDFAIWSVQVKADVKCLSRESDSEMRITGCRGASGWVVGTRSTRSTSSTSIVPE